jgi:zinc transporter 1/2/3
MHDLKQTSLSVPVNEKGHHQLSINETTMSNNHHGHHGHSHALPIPHSQDEDMLVSSLRGLLIVLALSIHELFEGFAVGLEKTEHGVYYL